jgi:hypothetical protein
MKLFNSMGPNPHVVRMFIAEIGLDIETIEVDLVAGENRQEEHLKRNPSGQMPALELDNGDFIAEITAICEFLDEINGHSDLIGKTPEERAETKMWVRRIDLQIIEPLTNGFRSAEGYELFKERLHLIPQAADLKPFVKGSIICRSILLTHIFVSALSSGVFPIRSLWPLISSKNSQIAVISAMKSPLSSSKAGI